LPKFVNTQRIALKSSLIVLLLVLFVQVSYPTVAKPDGKTTHEIEVQLVLDKIWFSHKLDWADYGVTGGGEDLFLIVYAREKGFDPDLAILGKCDINIDKCCDRNEDGIYNPNAKDEPDKELGIGLFQIHSNKGSSFIYYRKACESLNPFELEFKIVEIDGEPCNDQGFLNRLKSIVGPLENIIGLVAPKAKKAIKTAKQAMDAAEKYLFKGFTIDPTYQGWTRYESLSPEFEVGDRVINPVNTGDVPPPKKTWKSKQYVADLKDSEGDIVAKVWFHFLMYNTGRPCKCSKEINDILGDAEDAKSDVKKVEVYQDKVDGGKLRIRVKTGSELTPNNGSSSFGYCIFLDSDGTLYSLDLAPITEVNGELLEEPAWSAELKKRVGSEWQNLEDAWISDWFVFNDTISISLPLVEIGNPSMLRLRFVSLLDGIEDDSAPDEGWISLPIEPVEFVFVANYIDEALSLDVRRELASRGVVAACVPPSMFDKYRDSKFILIAGGPDAYEGTGEIVRQVLPESEQGAIRQGPRVVLVFGPWASGQKVIVAAGPDRNATQFALMQGLESIYNQLLLEDENVPMISWIRLPQAFYVESEAVPVCTSETLVDEIEICFSELMDEQATVQSITFVPETEAEFEWEDSMLIIRIDNLLEIPELEIEIGIGALDLAGNSIKEVTRIAISPGYAFITQQRS